MHEDKYIPVTESGCFIWLAAVDKAGYGRVAHNGKVVGAHRLMYEQEYGKIPKGKLILHRCDCPSCVNPAHLYAGSQQDNMNDKRGRDRHGRLRFTKEMKKEFAERYKNGESQASIGREYGIQRGYVGMLIKSHLNGEAVYPSSKRVSHKRN